MSTSVLQNNFSLHDWNTVVKSITILELYFEQNVSKEVLKTRLEW